jgi:hypothetical protein
MRAAQVAGHGRSGKASSFTGSRIGRGSAFGTLAAAGLYPGNQRRVIVKARITKFRAGNLGAARAHLRYIQRDGVRPEGENLENATLAGAFLKGILAALAVFMIGQPDRSRLWELLPLPILVFWLGSMGYQCLTNWVAFGPEGMTTGETAQCFATLFVMAVPLTLQAILMLRNMARLEPNRMPCWPLCPFPELQPQLWTSSIRRTRACSYCSSTWGRQQCS